MPNQQDGWLKFIRSSTLKASPTLLTIAGELRNRIYDLVLLEDEKVYPFDYKPCGCNCPKHTRQAPTISLLRVNKQINLEATAILYSSVTFHLTTGYVLMKFMALGEICMYGAPGSKQIFPSRHLIRSLHLKVMPEHMPTEVHSGRMLECWADPHFQHITKKQRAQIIHQYYREVCQAVWTNAGKVITQMEKLNVLSLNVEQAFCPNGCCRMVGHVLRSFRGFRKKENFNIKISGELKPEEKIMLLKGLGSKDDTTWEVETNAIFEEDNDESLGDDSSVTNEDEDEAEDEDEDGDAETSSSEEDGEDEDSETSDGDITMATLRTLHAAIQGTASILNGHLSNAAPSPSTVNLAVSSVEYPPQ